MTASGKVDFSEAARNRKAMANVTNSGAAGGTVAAKEVATPAELEKQLVRRAQGGDASAYEELVRIHQHRVLAVVNGILRGSADVEDVAQQALAKAYFSIRRFDQRSAFGTWLHKIAVNECWDYLRKKKVRRLVYESDLGDLRLFAIESGKGNANAGQYSSNWTGTKRRDYRRTLNSSRIRSNG